MGHGGTALSELLPAGSSAFTQDPEDCSMASSPLSESPMLALSSSKEVDIVSIEAGALEDSTPLSSAYEKLVFKLNIDWPVVRASWTSRQPFFPDLHTEVLRSRNKLFFSCISNPKISNYASIMGIKEYGYKTMPRFKETLAFYLSCIVPQGSDPVHQTM